MLNNGLTKKKKTKVAFFSPYYEQPRGNSTTAKRIEAGMKQAGYELDIFAYEEESCLKRAQKLIEQADLVHILHLRRFQLWQKRTNVSVTKPYVLTSGGTDINHDIFIDEYASDLRGLVAKACAITVFSEDGKQKVKRVFTMNDDLVYVIPQSIWLPSYPETVQVEPKACSVIEGPHLLLPAGLRPVKDVLYLLPVLPKLKERYPNLTFTIIGAVLDQHVYEQVKAACHTYEWIHYHKEVPLEEMADIYKQADIVVNTSVSEGQSTAILEAMYIGKPVIARQNEGNASIIQDGHNGYLFSSPEEFELKLDSLLAHPDDASLLFGNARKTVVDTFRFNTEIERYIDVYRHCQT
ncbi:glycosyltransferase [Desertibacillus haloalkaliphilus]|uniref:glycosyltransferase n=1 Tax=Desertibacillus haloalkaliphilus TaxID=1328930 RepID=UPI001C26A469|nr:glycosyltransferase [Desertibacillus haloalkaliphilus]MBU8907412.1 glycosyltransferase family 4 protein [Desertibacillus haloalkaliphilus]